LIIRARAPHAPRQRLHAEQRDEEERGQLVEHKQPRLAAVTCAIAAEAGRKAAALTPYLPSAVVPAVSDTDAARAGGHR